MILVGIVGVAVSIQIGDGIAGEERLPIGLLSLFVVGVRKEITATSL
jgi:hypothetical protein